MTIDGSLMIIVNHHKLQLIHQYPTNDAVSGEENDRSWWCRQRQLQLCSPRHRILPEKLRPCPKDAAPGQGSVVTCDGSPKWGVGWSGLDGCSCCCQWWWLFLFLLVLGFLVSDDEHSMIEMAASTDVVVTLNCTIHQRKSFAKDRPIPFYCRFQWRDELANYALGTHFFRADHFFMFLHQRKVPTRNIP